MRTIISAIAYIAERQVMFFYEEYSYAKYAHFKISKSIGSA